MDDYVSYTGFKLQIGPISTTINDLVLQASGKTETPSQYSSVCSITQVFSSKKIAAINDLVNAGVVPVLVDCLSQEDEPYLQRAILRALIKLPSAEQVDRIVAAGAIPKLVRMLTIAHPRVVEEALGVLANIIADKPNVRDMAIEQGIVQPMISCIDDKLSESCILRFISVIKHMCMPSSPLTGAIANKLLTALNLFIQGTDVGILQNTLAAISNLTDGDKEQMCMVVASGIVPKLLALLKNNELVELLEFALHVIGKIVRYAAEFNQVVFNLNVQSYMPALLGHEEMRIRTSALELLSDMIVGMESHVEALIDNGLIPHIVKILNKDHVPVLAEAARVISNIMKLATDEQVLAMIDAGILQSLLVLNGVPVQELNDLAAESLTVIRRSSAYEIESVANLMNECEHLKPIWKHGYLNTHYDPAQ